MSNIQYRQSSPEESRRWAAYLARRTEAICDASPLRRGMRLAVLPSFAPQRCWTVERSRARNSPLVGATAELVVSEINGDYERFLSASPEEQLVLEPVVARRTFALDDSTLTRLETLLGEVTVPLAIREPSVGTDGTSFRLELRAAANSLSLQWWWKGPSNWKAVFPCFRAVWDALDEIAGVSETPW